MFHKIIFIVLFSLSSILANELNSSYINITSNVDDTTIFINGVEIGMTPIKLEEVTPNKTLKIKAVVDNKYYKKDLYKFVTVLNNTIPTIHFEFERAKAKLFFIGDPADLYVDNKYIRRLESDTRVYKTDANENLKIKLVDGDKRITLYRNIEANKSYKIEYDLIDIPKDIRINTTMINDLMWEDTLHAKNATQSWERSVEYCELLRIGKFKDWKVPSIEQLDDLFEKYKDEIYNGYGDNFYWSHSTSQSDSKIWDYSLVKNFQTGKKKKPIVEIDTGHVRCVRTLNKDKNNKITFEATETKKKKKKKKRDENLTKNLERFLLK